MMQTFLSSGYVGSTAILNVNRRVTICKCRAVLDHSQLFALFFLLSPSRRRQRAAVDDTAGRAQGTTVGAQHSATSATAQHHDRDEAHAALDALLENNGIAASLTNKAGSDNVKISDDSEAVDAALGDSTSEVMGVVAADAQSAGAVQDNPAAAAGTHAVQVGGVRTWACKVPGCRKFLVSVA